MQKETLVIRPEMHKRRVGVLPTYAQRDRTKYTRKAKHGSRDGGPGEQHGKVFVDAFPCCSCRQSRISSVGRANVS